MSDFRIGDRVRIFAPSHPWAGSDGVIVDRWRGASFVGFDWEVRLDRGDYEGHTVAAHTTQLRTANSHSESER